MTTPHPDRGLPGPLPRGERILWQGSPTTGGIARRALHIDLVAAYFVVLLIWGSVAALSAGPTAERLLAIGTTALTGAAALGLLALLSWLSHRTTVYTITDRRVVMQIGIALPMTLNLPLTSIEAAALRDFSDGSADIPLTLKPGTRIAYLHLWPHARPWRLGRPEPMLRCVPEGANVAALLSRALAASCGDAQLDHVRTPIADTSGVRGFSVGGLGQESI